MSQRHKKDLKGELMDFFQIKQRSAKNGVTEVYPDFLVKRARDLMVRAKGFYGIWDEDKGLWSTDEYDVQRLVDAELTGYANELREKSNSAIHIKYMGDFSTNAWSQYRRYLNHISDNSKPLDIQFKELPPAKQKSCIPFFLSSVICNCKNKIYIFLSFQILC